MGKSLSEIEKEVFMLSDHERATLAHHLIITLDKDEDEDVEEIWLNEAEKRYEEYKKGKIKAVSSEEAFQEARNRLL